MFSTLTNLALRHPRRMAALTVVFFIAAGIFGGPAAGMLKARNGFQDPSSPSAREQQMIQNATGAEDAPGVMVLVKAPPSSPRVKAVGRIVAQVPGVASVTLPPTLAVRPRPLAVDLTRRPQLAGGRQPALAL